MDQNNVPVPVLLYVYMYNVPVLYNVNVSLTCKKKDCLTKLSWLKLQNKCLKNLSITFSKQFQFYKFKKIFLTTL